SGAASWRLYSAKISSRCSGMRFLRLRMRDAGDGVVSLFFPGSQETSKQGYRQDDCSTDDRPARSVLTLYENDPYRVQNRFYDADDCGVESTDMFDCPRVKQVGNRELEDAK